MGRPSRTAAAGVAGGAVNPIPYMQADDYRQALDTTVRGGQGGPE